MPNRTTIEQWRSLIAFAETGTYAKAGRRLHRSPSAVFDAVAQLAARLDVDLVAVEGRRSRLTAHGEALLRRARWIVRELEELEALATDFKAGWEAEIGLAVEVIFPPRWLREALRRFEPESRSVRLQLFESVLSSTTDLLTAGRVDLAVLPEVPAGFFGRPLTTVALRAVAHRDHPLHHAGGPLRLEDLATQRQFVIRDPGAAPVDAGWLGAEKRWTVSDLQRSIASVCDGLGFAWLPEAAITGLLADGTLKPLPLRDGHTRPVLLHLVLHDRDRAGPAVLRLAQILTELCAAPHGGATGQRSLPNLT